MNSGRKKEKSTKDNTVFEDYWLDILLAVFPHMHQFHAIWCMLFLVELLLFYTTQTEDSPVSPSIPVSPMILNAREKSVSIWQIYLFLLPEESKLLSIDPRV